MVRDNRIKEYRFPTQYMSGADQDLTLYSDYPINGEILTVDWIYNSTGSIWLTMSGTGEEFFRRVAPSGAGTQTSNPRAFGHHPTTGSISAASQVTYSCNDKIILNVLNSGSVAQGLTVNVRYR